MIWYIKKDKPSIIANIQDAVRRSLNVIPKGDSSNVVGKLEKRANRV